MLTLAGGAAWIVVALAAPSEPFAVSDAHAYFAAGPPHLYGLLDGAADAYLYSPAFWQASEPLRGLGWGLFVLLIRLADAGAITWLAGPWSLAILLFTPALAEIGNGNVNLILAVAIVVGFRHPGAWAVALLTKITPGVGLAWFAFRREWRRLGIALAVTVGIGSISFVLWPQAWIEWAGYLSTAQVLDKPYEPLAIVVPLPLAMRLVMALAVVAIGARLNRPWTVPIAALLAMPVIWFSSLTLLLGALKLAGPVTRRSSGRRSDVRGLHRIEGDGPSPGPSQTWAVRTD